MSTSSRRGSWTGKARLHIERELVEEFSDSGRAVGALYRSVCRCSVYISLIALRSALGERATRPPRSSQRARVAASGLRRPNTTLYLLIYRATANRTAPCSHLPHTHGVIDLARHDKKAHSPKTPPAKPSEAPRDMTTHEPVAVFAWSFARVGYRTA